MSKHGVLDAFSGFLKRAWQLTSHVDGMPDGGEPLTPAGGRPASLRSSTPVVPPENLDDTSQLVINLLSQGRYALLLRQQIAANLSASQRLQAEALLDEFMAIVPEGDVLLRSWKLDGERKRDEDKKNERLVHVDALYLDRYLVSNAEYKRFVDAGGYEQIQLWDQAIWPAVLDFVDLTGHSGPRFWKEGEYEPHLEHHPVVGVSWYEACAYSRWAGKRLPSDPEWVKAGCWPVLTQGTKPVQRKFPWGDTMDRSLANLWTPDQEGTVPVDANPEGVSVGGVYQLIGNVWEWTTSQFGAWDATGRRLELEAPMKSIRGGSFDTYFDSQASCQFQSGESPLARKYNIGFRCALSMCDVIDFTAEESDHEPELAPCGVSHSEELE